MIESRTSRYLLIVKIINIIKLIGKGVNKMGFWDLFRGYAFFKLVKVGIGFVVLGFVITSVIILEQEFALLICNVPLLLMGGALLYFALGIWRKEKASDTWSSNSTWNSHSSEENLMTCPKCGEEKMKVEFDDSGFCKNCGHTTKGYYEDIDYND